MATMSSSLVLKSNIQWRRCLVSPKSSYLPHQYRTQLSFPTNITVRTLRCSSKKLDNPITKTTPSSSAESNDKPIAGILKPIAETLKKTAIVLATIVMTMTMRLGRLQINSAYAQSWRNRRRDMRGGACSCVSERNEPIGSSARKLGEREDKVKEGIEKLIVVAAQMLGGGFTQEEEKKFEEFDRTWNDLLKSADRDFAIGLWLCRLYIFIAAVGVVHFLVRFLFFQ